MNGRLTDERLAELRTIAEADVSPGPWRVALDAPCFLSVASTEGWRVAACGDEVTKHSSEDANFIAAFDPPTVLALLDELERLRSHAGPAGCMAIARQVLEAAIGDEQR